MTQSERIELRKKNDWRPNHYVDECGVFEHNFLVEVEEWKWLKVSAIVDKAIYKMIAS